MKETHHLTTTRNKKTILVHRLIWQEHNGEIPKGMIIHHKDKDKMNNNIENLECLTRSEHRRLHPNNAGMIAYHKARKEQS